VYFTILFVHVLSAIVALGYNATYAVWLTRGSLEREHLLFALRGIQFMDSRVANPAYGLLLVTGIAMVLLSGRSWHQLWIELALALWVLLAILGFAGYTPALKRQIRIVETSGPDDPAYGAANSRQTVFGIVTSVIAVVIVALMVFRPGGA
jgi:uncharacterized membrane protein